jgi:molecular chaperone IbpA
MLNFDLTPVFRSTVGFEPLMDALDDALRLGGDAGHWPPYNIEKLDEEDYRISIAVPGFAMDDLGIEVRDNLLTVTGKRPAADEKVTYLHQGIGAGQFERQFRLADFVQVAEAKLVNGLLQVHLRREMPERLKPRQIAINNGKAIEGKAKKAA